MFVGVPKEGDFYGENDREFYEKIGNGRGVSDLLIYLE